ncbi:MAG TPA: DUF4384 domain-containing protein [Bryobacteraceae bacterium]|nr:DUF4384 domain-containing protein [Bryobacteraceae bacterium]
MSFSSNFLISLSTAAAFVSIAPAQTAQPAPQSKLTARELFYSAGPEADGGKKSTPKGSTSKGSKGSGSKASQPAASPKNNAVTPTPGGSALPGGGQVINASAGPPIGITYTVRRRAGGAMVDVSPESVFHKDDRIDFIVQTNYPGYLYIGNKGPAGGWTPLFPSPQIENGDNRVEAFRKYTMPPGYRFIFDEKTGVEEVFILFSRVPVPDFEELLYSEKAGSKPSEKPAPKPLSVAKVDLPETTVDRLRSAFSRDLLIEKIDDEKPGDHKEKAVYVVNPTGASDSHVWADIRLVHK